MRHFMNVGHVQFDLLIAGNAEQVIGKMVHADELGITILVESTGEYHAYGLLVVQHACLAS